MLVLLSVSLAWGQELTAQAGRMLPSAGCLREINGYTVLTVEGSPHDMGRQHGELLGATVRRVVEDVVVSGAGSYDLEGLLDGAMVMERFLPNAIREELGSLAEAARVDYRHLVALQLFGDVSRGRMCTGFAVFGPATATGECICGRNMDYWDYGAGEYAAILLHCKPANGYDFFTCSWAGIINGWTALNECGIVCSNNSAYGGEDSLEGLSTCFMVRKVAQFAATVDEGIRIVETTPRACGTNLLIAGGDPPDAAIVEYDHEQVVVRKATEGYVVADNSFLALGKTTGNGEWGIGDGERRTAEAGNGTGEPGRQETTHANDNGEADQGAHWDAEPARPDTWTYEPSSYSRAGTLLRLIRENYGRIDRTMNFAAAPGVPIRSMNLHSALIFVADRAMYISMGVAPAADQPYRGFRLTPDGILGLDIRYEQFPSPEADPQP